MNDNAPKERTFSEHAMKERLQGLFSTITEVTSLPAAMGEDETLPTFSLDALFSEVDNLDVLVEASKTATDRAQTTTSMALTPSIVAPEQAIVRTTPHTIATPEELLLGSNHADDRYMAVQQLGALRQAWTIVPLLQAAADSDADVAWLAIHSLLPMRSDVIRFVLAQIHQPATLLHQGGTAFLSHLVGQPLVFIPPGPFLMGSHPSVDVLATPYEQPRHELSLPGYWISRYPVITARFYPFINESGYQPQGIGWQQGQLNHPVVGLTWYDALTYCDWLSQRCGLHISLPSEAQWEKAARGTDGRTYPWGNQTPTPALCSFLTTTPVGHFSPQGDSPYGCADMTGNVWEWTRSAFYPYPYRPNDGREELHEKEPRVIRGSTFNDIARFSRCTFRYSLTPEQFLPTLGFRLVVMPGGGG